MGRFARGLRQAAPEPSVAGRIVLTFATLAFWAAVTIGHNPFLFAVCALVALLLASAAATSLSVPRLRVERALPERVVAGRPFPVRLRATNVSRRPGLGLTFRDALQTAAAGETACTAPLPALPPGASVEIEYEGTLRRRGVYTISDGLVASRFPFGLFERRRLFRDPRRIVVLPPLGRLRRAAFGLERPRPARAFALAGAEEFYALREHREGDNPRHIHWKTTARRGVPMRREMRGESRDEAVLLLDTSEAGPVLERAISCAATFLVEAARQGRAAAVHFPRGCARVPAGVRDPARALEALAAIRAGDVPAHRLVAQAPLARGARAVLLLLRRRGRRAAEAAARRSLALTVLEVRGPRFAEAFSRR